MGRRARPETGFSPCPARSQSAIAIRNSDSSRRSKAARNCRSRRPETHGPRGSHEQHVHSLIKLPNLHRHDQPGYFSLGDLPQLGSVADIAISTGWWELDQIWRSYPGQFNVVTGIAGHGKSTLMLNVMVNVAKKYGTGSFLYVPENEQHMRDKFCKKSGGRKRASRTSASTQCFVQSRAPTRYDSEPKDLRWVLDKAATAVEHDNASMVLIDPWNELERAKQREQLMTDYIGECLMMLKQFCRA
jgi:twinkle protein